MPEGRPPERGASHARLARRLRWLRGERVRGKRARGERVRDEGRRRVGSAIVSLALAAPLLACPPAFGPGAHAAEPRGAPDPAGPNGTTRGVASGWPAELVGHGGPVKSIALRGRAALTASFDYAAVLWDLAGAAPREVHRLIGHRAAVNDAAFAGDRAITASDDGAVMIWDLATGEAVARHETAGEKVMAVAVSRDGALAASAHWDDRARLYDVASGALLAVLEGHRGPVNDAAFGPDGTLYTASQDGTIRAWTPGADRPRPVADLGWGVNVLATIRRGGEPWLVAGALDGTLVALPLAAPERVARIAKADRPIMALAVAPDGGAIAYGDGAGLARVLDVTDWSERALIARPGPVWGLAFADADHLYLAGLDDRVFGWRANPNRPLATPPETFPRRFQARAGEVGPGELQFRRKCSVCHTLTPDDANRAGPTLHGIFGRPVASLPGYPYSDAMRSLDIVWSEETVAELFEHGPDTYTPGSKMPMQRIVDPADRRALVEFLREATQ